MAKLLLIFSIIFINACSSVEHLKLNLLDNTITVFKSGEEGYQCYRIPAIIQGLDGQLIAFCEGRKNGCSDTNDIDIIMKSSNDFGQSWSPIQVIWDDSINTCGNPAPVMDRETGTIHLLSTWNLGIDHEQEIIAETSQDTRRIFYIHSKDNGLTWKTPKEITTSVKQPNWTWYATGPGSGIQMNSLRFSNRLIIACDHIEAGSKKYYSHIIYSDDNGQNWNLGGTSPNEQVNECEVAELRDGRLLLNMRNYNRNMKHRQTAISDDGGINWKSQRHDDQLVEPICQASLLSCEFDDVLALVFSNPANSDKRINMTIRTSFDYGISWVDSFAIHPGPAAYSDLVALSNGNVGCLFECGENSPYERIDYVNFELK